MSHRVSNDETATTTKAWSGAKSSLQGQFYKTRMCPYLNKSKNGCKRKSSCCYAHNESELQKTIDLTKTKLCNKFEADNYCPNDPCQFAHGFEELRSTNHCFKTQLCRKFAQTGTCSTGDYCRHAHGPEEAEIVRRLRESGLLSRQIHLLHFGDFLESVGVERPQTSELLEHKNGGGDSSSKSSKTRPNRNSLHRCEAISSTVSQHKVYDFHMDSKSPPCHSSSLTNINSDNGSQSIKSALSGPIQQQQQQPTREDEGLYSNISNVIPSSPNRVGSLPLPTLLEGNGNLTNDDGTATIEILFSNNPYQGINLDADCGPMTSHTSKTNLFNNAAYGIPLSKKSQVGGGYYNRFPGGGMSRDESYFNFLNSDRENPDDSKDYPSGNTTMAMGMVPQDMNGKYGVPPELRPGLRSCPSGSIVDQGMPIPPFDGVLNSVTSANVHTPPPIRTTMSTSEALRSLGGDTMNGLIDLSGSQGIRPNYFDFARSISYGTTVNDYHDQNKNYPPYPNSFPLPNPHYVTSTSPNRTPARRFDSTFFSGNNYQDSLFKSEMSLELDSLIEKEQ